MKKIIILLLYAVTAFSCSKIDVGYLNLGYAGYSVDSLVMRIELDGKEGEFNPEIVSQWEEWAWEFYSTIEEWALDSFIVPIYTVEPGIDSKRAKFKIPWQSMPIEGVEGTKPIFLTVGEIKASEGGNADKMKESLQLRGDGTFLIPLTHSVPVGRYVISIDVKNEGYTSSIKDCYTIIVKQRK